MADLAKGSARFAGVDLQEAFGIRCDFYDVLTPKMRERKVKLPGRDGSYDYGARFHDERIVKLKCESMKMLSRQEIRELAAALSKKGELYLWDEPDKYYVGRIYKAPDLVYIGLIGHRFDLEFICDPFAYGETISGPMPTIMTYKGTAITPTRIEIRNISNKTLQGVQIQIRERSES